MQTKLEELESRIERLEETGAPAPPPRPVFTGPVGAPHPPAPPHAPRTVFAARVAPPKPPARPQAALRTPPSPAPRPAPAPPRPAPAPAMPPRPARPRGATLEDVLGGRVLAWAGGLAVVAALVLMFAMAVSRGWLDEGARTVLGGAFSLGLGGVGLWLQERRGRSDAALAAMAAGAAGLFLTVLVAARVYELIPTSAGVALALVVGAAVTVVAVRWESPVIGALGLIGGLLSPVLVG